MPTNSFIKNGFTGTSRRHPLAGSAVPALDPLDAIGSSPKNDVPGIGFAQDVVGFGKDGTA